MTEGLAQIKAQQGQVLRKHEKALPICLSPDLQSWTHRFQRWASAEDRLPMLSQCVMFLWCGQMSLREQDKSHELSLTRESCQNAHIKNNNLKGSFSMLKTTITRIFLFLLLCTAPEIREKPNWRQQKGIPSSHTFSLTTQTVSSQ